MSPPAYTVTAQGRVTPCASYADASQLAERYLARRLAVRVTRTCDGVVVWEVTPAKERNDYVMDLITAKQKLARALKQACEEHGRPNSFGCAELFSYHGGPPTMLAGRIGSQRLYPLWQELGGRDAWGSCPVYDNGRFYV